MHVAFTYLILVFIIYYSSTRFSVRYSSGGESRAQPDFHMVVRDGRTRCAITFLRIPSGGFPGKRSFPGQKSHRNEWGMFANFATPPLRHRISQRRAEHAVASVLHSTLQNDTLLAVRNYGFPGNSGCSAEISHPLVWGETTGDSPSSSPYTAVYVDKPRPLGEAQRQTIVLKGYSDKRPAQVFCWTCEARPTQTTGCRPSSVYSPFIPMGLFVRESECVHVRPCNTICRWASPSGLGLCT